ncbi:MAG TPA: hypothetical protein VF681_04810 [Abditibacteriaceae bacterium]|jgi:hypothetical protein
MDNINSRLKLSLQKALLGAITDNLYAVTAGFEGQWIRIDAYFTGDITAEDRDSISVAATEVIADFATDFMIDERCYSLLEHNSLKTLDFWAFLRQREENSPPII